MLLSDLIDGVDPSIAKLKITGITDDSRDVRPGFLFAALRGIHADGVKYIPTAIKAGAAVILTRDGIEVNGVPVVHVPHARTAFAHVVAKFYPGQPKHIVAVTGTSGKSSVVTFCQQIWQRLNVKGASLGTIGVFAKNIAWELSLTTPDTITTHKMLDRLADAGITHVAMEASSQGIDQFRMEAVNIQAAAFTNLSRDHIDYHLTMEAYLQAKLGLFERLLPADGIAVFNADAPEANQVKAICDKRQIKTWSYGERGDDFKILSFTHQQLKLNVFGKDYELHFPLYGFFQVQNAVCAAALVIAAGARAEDVIPQLTHLTPVNGRLELVATLNNGARIFNDYAHKPEGLEKILTILRTLTKGKLHVVFGCGGDRDKGKRPIMGDIAGRLADAVIVTDDNPRSEIPETIRAEIMQGCPDAQNIGDRELAIQTAIKALGPNDVLVVAGKGHEEGQKVGDKVIPFSDAAVIKKVVQEVQKAA